MVSDRQVFRWRSRFHRPRSRRLKQLYATSFEIDPTWLIQSAARRQKWIDQAQSLNLYISEPSGKKLDALYREAWHSGLKDDILSAFAKRDSRRKVDAQKDRRQA